jgi:hypothetical protein
MASLLADGCHEAAAEFFVPSLAGQEKADAIHESQPTADDASDAVSSAPPAQADATALLASANEASERVVQLKVAVEVLLGKVAKAEETAALAWKSVASAMAVVQQQSKREGEAADERRRVKSKES